MKSDDYIGGARHGRRAHDLELEAMGDPLLADALDGFNAVPGDHSATLERLSVAILRSAAGGRAVARARSSRLREQRIRGWSVAAAALFLAAAAVGGAWLLRDGVSTDTSRIPARQDEYYSDKTEVAILPPVVVVPNDAGMAARATDISKMRLDGQEVRSLAGAVAAEPARDTTLTAAFRRYVRGAPIVRSALTGSATLSFEVGPGGRPQNIETVGSTSPDAAATALELLEEGPDWPAEPSRKLITIDL